MNATWGAIARKDFEDAMRSKVLWALTGIFVAFIVMSMLSAEELIEGVDTVTPSLALAGVAMLAQLFIPGLALAAGYLAITGERRDGSLRVLMSYPFTPFAVILGKLVGRLALTMSVLLTGFAVATAMVVVLYGLPSLTALGGFIGAGVLVGATFTGLAVGGSAMATSRGRAMAWTMGPFVAMMFFWKPVVVGLHYVLEGGLPGVQVPSWYILLKRLNPLEAYRVVVGKVLGEPVYAIPDFPLEDLPMGTMPADLGMEDRIAGEIPFYLSDWFAVVILLAWGILPVLYGYRYFVRSDLD